MKQKPAIFIIIASLLTLCSCQDKEIILTKRQINVKVDSVLATKKEDLARQAAEDLDRRKAIEVKAKADSIVEAYLRTQPIPAQDTTPPPQP